MSPLVKQAAVRAALPFQIESHMPYPLDQLIVNTSLHQQGPDTTQARVIAAHQEKIRTHLDTLSNQELRPGWVSCYPQALFRFSRHYFPEINHCIVLFFGSEETSLIAIVDGALHIASSFAIGEKDFIQLWRKQYPQDELPEDLSEIFARKNPALHSLKERFCKELDRSIHFINSKCKTALHDTLITLGQYDQLFSSEYFQQHDMQVHQSKHAVYAVAIGLALDTSVQNETSVQFLKGQFTPSTHLGRLGKKLCISLCMATFIACFTQALTGRMISKNTQQLENKIAAYSQSWAKKKSLAIKRLETAYSSRPPQKN